MKLNWKFKGGGGGWIFFRTTTHNIGLINNSTIFTEPEENNNIFFKYTCSGIVRATVFSFFLFFTSTLLTFYFCTFP